MAAEAAKDIADGAADTVKKTGGALKSTANTVLNQFHPFGKKDENGKRSGKLWRNFKWASAAAIVGTGVVFTGGAAAAAALPFSTALGTSMTAAAAGTGAGATAAAAAAASGTGVAAAHAATIATGQTIAASGLGSGTFLNTAWAAGTDFAAHAANGAYFLGSSGWEIGSNIATNADWEQVQTGLSTVQSGLAGP